MACENKISRKVFPFIMHINEKEGIPKFFNVYDSRFCEKQAESGVLHFRNDIYHHDQLSQLLFNLQDNYLITSAVPKICYFIAKIMARNSRFKARSI